MDGLIYMHHQIKENIVKHLLAENYVLCQCEASVKSSASIVSSFSKFLNLMK